MRKLIEFVRDAGAWGVASELASVVLYIIGIITVTKWGATVGTMVTIAGSVPLFWLGAYIAWSKKATELEAEKGRQSKPEIIGRIVEAHVRMHGRSTEKGLSTPSCLLVLKFSVTNRTAVDSTLRDASLLVQTNGQEYISQRIELGMGDFYQTAYNSIPRRMNDLIVSTTYSTPIRKAVASDGWLEFLVDGLNAAENNAVRADLIVTLTDELGSEHIIKADNVTINR